MYTNQYIINKKDSLNQDLFVTYCQGSAFAITLKNLYNHNEKNVKQSASQVNWDHQS